MDLAITRVVGSHRQAAIKELTAMRERLFASDTKDHQAVRDEVALIVNEIGRRVDATLTERLSQIETLIQDPGTERSRIETERDGLDGAAASLEAHDARLITLREQASSLSELVTCSDC